MPSDVNCVELARQGYLPAEINLDDRVVSFAKLADYRFHQAWYSDTVDEIDSGRRYTVPFRAIVEQFADRRDDQHLRLIAHTSRCGSTLLANLLALRPTTMVLKEPDFVTVPAQQIALAAGRSADGQGSQSLLRALLNVSCHAAAAAGRELVVKVTSWTVPVVAEILRHRTNTSWLFLWREPELVVASNLAAPSTWGRDTANGRAARTLAGAPAQDGDVEFYADTWKRIVETFLSSGDDLHWRSLDYQDLASDKEAALLATERWFNIAPGAGLPNEFEQESQRYSKGSIADVFEPSRTHRRSPLKPHEARQVTAITNRALESLRAERDHRLF
jgi:hypothetical protein